ncbi:MAG: hypothetical protein ACJAYJ_002416 [Saprospiraceae bacterium]|jgi:hypothetical protein
MNKTGLSNLKNNQTLSTMKKQISTNLLVLLATIAYNLLFWSEKMGVNSLIFTIIMLPILFYVHPEGRKSKPALITALGTLLTAILIVWNNSLLTKIIHMLSFLTFVGFMQARVLRFVWFGFLLGGIKYWCFSKENESNLPQKRHLFQDPKNRFSKLSIVGFALIGHRCFLLNLLQCQSRFL